MSQVHFERASVAVVAAFVVIGPLHAQTAPTVTIGDYSAAQRQAIDADIQRALAKARGGSEIVVPAPTSALAIPVLGAASAPAHPAPQEPRLAVTGVAKLRGGWVVEVVTDAGAFLLTEGQAVPGTPWLVQSVEPTRAILFKPAERKGGAPVLRNFAFSGVVR